MNFTQPEIYSNLPKPFQLRREQVREAYQNVYDTLSTLYSNRDFIGMNSFMNETWTKTLTVDIAFPSVDIEKGEVSKIDDNLLNQLVILLYKIITTNPIQSYRTQILAVTFLLSILKQNHDIPNLTLEWKPYYRFMKFMFTNPESKEIQGADIPSNNEIIKGIYKYILELCSQLSRYFPDEVTNDDGTITNTTEQILHIFLPKISSRGSESALYLDMFERLCPHHAGRYKLYWEFCLDELQSPISIQSLESILKLIKRSIKYNCTDDFSSLVPPLFQFISLYYIREQTIKPAHYDTLSNKSYFKSHQCFISDYLAKIVIGLFIAPKTRNAIIEHLESLFSNFKEICHPATSKSREKTNHIGYFMKNIESALKSYLNKMTNKEKTFFSLSEEKWPNQKEIHEILSMICELRLLFIRNMDLITMVQSIRIETILDPTLIDRYFDFAAQCINIMDAMDVAQQGWSILTALIMNIDVSDKIRDNFEVIFEIAAVNCARNDLQAFLAYFFAAVFLKIPFNNQNTIDDCQNFDFKHLAYLLESNVMAIFRKLPSRNGKKAAIDTNLISLMRRYHVCLYENCGKDVMHSLLPIFVQLSTDIEIAPSAPHIMPIIRYYCMYASKEDYEIVLNSFRKQLEATSNNNSMFYYLSYIYSNIATIYAKTIDDVRPVVNFLLTFTKSDNKKVRKLAWKALSHSLTYSNKMFSPIIKVKTGKTLENVKFDDLDIAWQDRVDYSSLLYEIFSPVYDELLHSKDPQRIVALLKETKGAIKNAIEWTFENNKGDEALNDKANKTPMKILDTIDSLNKDSVEIKDKFVTCAIRLLTDFHENKNILMMVIKTCNCLFSSLRCISSIFRDPYLRFCEIMFPKMNEDIPYLNKQFVFNSLTTAVRCRELQIIFPMTNNYKKLFELLVNFGTSNFKAVRMICSQSIYSAINSFKEIFEPLIENIIDRSDQITIDDFITFLTMKEIADVVKFNDTLLYKAFISLCKKFSRNEEIKEPRSYALIDNFLQKMCFGRLPLGNAHDNPEMFRNLLKTIEDKYISQKVRILQLAIMCIIFMSLKSVYDVSDTLFKYILRNVTYYDRETSRLARINLSIILRRRSKFTTEKVMKNDFPTVADFPNPFDDSIIKLPENFDVFGMSNKDIEKENPVENAEPNVPSINHHHESAFYEVDMKSIKIDKVVKSIFNSFAQVEIEWNKRDFDVSFYDDMGNGDLMYQKSYMQKKCEFINDQLIIQSIPYILASNLSATGESYIRLWETISMTIGPYCIDTLHQSCMKLLSEKQPSLHIPIAAVLSDMIQGLMVNIEYWSKESRIELFKKVVLPTFFIVNSNPNTAKQAYGDIFLFLNNCPFAFSPMLKIVNELAVSGPNRPIYNRPLVDNISSIISVKPMYFFNAISPLTEKFVRPFIEHFGDYLTQSIFNIISFIFSSFELCCINKKSPLYSEKVEDEKIKLIGVLEEIIENRYIEKVADKKQLLRKAHQNYAQAILQIVSFFKGASYEVKVLIAPIIIKHIGTILHFIKGCDVQDEQSMLTSIGDFMNSDIFFTNNELTFDLITNVIKELKYVSIPLQISFLDDIHDMIETNINNIPYRSYQRIEDVLLSYAAKGQTKKLGIIGLLKLSKIIGLFEMRKCTIDVNQNEYKSSITEENEIKAASIILNTLMFDQVDNRVNDAFEVLEKVSTQSKSNKKNFYKKLIEIFVHRHSGHVLPNVEEVITKYKCLVPPDYIC